MTTPVTAQPEYETTVTRLLAPALQAAVAEGAQIARVAHRLADVLAGGGHLYTFGAGHSKAVAEELCYRAGGLRGITSMNLDDLRDTPRPAHEQLSDSAPERDPANGAALLERYDVQPGDALFIASQSGRNGAIVELAKRARAAGTYTAAVLSRQHSLATTSRHPEGLRLLDLADDVIDNHGPVGDAVVDLGDGDRVGSASTVAGALIAQLLGVGIAQSLLQRGVEPQVIRSANVDEPASQA